MRRHGFLAPLAALPALALLLALAACGGKPPARTPPLPSLPPLQLQPFQPVLQALSTALPQVPEATQHELKDLADLALHLVEGDPRTVSRAERSLLDHTAAWSVLEPALQHDDVAVRRRAAWLCGQSGQSILQLPLLLRLKYELDPETVLWVADSLQRLGNDAGLRWLDAAMAVEATAQRAGTMAIEICRERELPLGETPSYAELQTHLRALGATWRERGVGSRANVAAPAPDQLETRFAIHLATTQGTLLRPIDDARYVLTRSGVLPLPLLIRALGASEPYLRTMALQVLAEIGAPARVAAPAVLPLLGDPLTGSYAVRTLGEIGAHDAIPHLQARLHSIDTELRAAVPQALGLLGDRTSEGALAGLMNDPQESLDVRVGAAFGLLALGANPAAEAFLAERERQADYHAATLVRLRERLALVPR